MPAPPPSRRRKTLVALALGATITPASAGAFVQFRSPTSNIGCVGEAGKRAYVRCDIQTHSWPTPRRPKSCEFDYGNGIGLNATGRATFLCASDTALHRDRILDYGKQIKIGQISCISQRSGMTCRNPAGHGFLLSKASYRIF